MQKNGTPFLQEIIAPFETNDNVDIQLQVGTCSLKISGVHDAVISAYGHITNQLNKCLHVKDRYVYNDRTNTLVYCTILFTH